jgi:hypothetical protein
VAGSRLGAGDRDDVQRVVELAVPAAVEAVLGALARGAGDRRGPGLQREARFRAEALVSGGVVDQDRRGQRPTPLLGEQLGAVRLDELRRLAVQLIDLAVEAAQLRDLFAGDPDPRAGRQFPQPPVDAVEHPPAVERAALKRGLELGAQLEQMPAQPVDRPGALGGEVASVIGDQPDLHCPLVQKHDREAVDPVLDDRAGDRQRVDLIGLARLALALAGGAHPLRRDPDDLLAGGQQRLLKALGDVPAVLDRPHAIIIQAAGPADRGQMPRLVGLDLAVAADPAGSLVDRRERVRALVRVRLGVELLMW